MVWNVDMILKVRLWFNLCESKWLLNLRELRVAREFNDIGVL